MCTLVHILKPRQYMEWLSTPHRAFFSGEPFAEFCVQRCPAGGRKRKGLNTSAVTGNPEPLPSKRQCQIKG